MSHNTTVTYKGITRVINPADLTSAAAMLSFYDATVHQYTVAGLRRLTFHLTVPERTEAMAIRDVQRVARQLGVGLYAEKTVVVEPPLRTTPRPGKRFHHGPHAINQRIWDAVKLSGRAMRTGDVAAARHIVTVGPGSHPDVTGPEAILPFRSADVLIRDIRNDQANVRIAAADAEIERLIFTPNPEGAPVADPAPITKKALKRAKKLKKAKKGHPATGVDIPSPAEVRALRPVEEIVEVAPEPITGYLHYEKGKEGNQKGKHRWIAIGLNHKVVDDSGEKFTSLRDSQRNIETLARVLQNPKVTYDPEDYPTKQ